MEVAGTGKPEVPAWEGGWDKDGVDNPGLGDGGVGRGVDRVGNLVVDSGGGVGSLRRNIIE